MAEFYNKYKAQAARNKILQEYVPYNPDAYLDDTFKPVGFELLFNFRTAMFSATCFNPKTVTFFAFMDDVEEKKALYEFGV